jgi:hypothetical protein
MRESDPGRIACSFTISLVVALGAPRFVPVAPWATQIFVLWQYRK